MHLSEVKSRIPEKLFEILKESGIQELRPSQQKAIDAGLLEGSNLLVCTPTASGKTLIAEFAALSAILHHEGKAIYVVPLKALASEKSREFKKRYANVAKVSLSIGDAESAELRLGDADLIVCTSEKLDSLIRHRSPWLKDIAVLIVDEVHLLNDNSRGPTLEVVITLLRQMLPELQIVALSATIGNPQELADWLHAKLIIDDWRPVPLKKGIFMDNVIEF